MKALDLYESRKQGASTHHLKEREVGVGYSIEVDAGVDPCVGPACVVQREALVAPRDNARWKRLAARLVDALDELAAKD